ncbi:MAG: amidase family protein, partial [Patescibacteria group bacterium]
MTDLKNLTIKKAGELLRNKQVSAVELTEYYLKNISEKNKDLNAYLEVFEDARKSAVEADARIVSLREMSPRDTGSPLLGIPLAIKDNILIKGHIASASSKILENYKAVYDATVITKLKKAGAIFLGRTNMDEFAMGSSTENSAYGVTKNPIDTTRVPGGSSGGSAAAVASDMAIAGLGSETGGSVRQPASLCGLVGLKPTYGAVSRHGLMAMGSSLDQIGQFGKTVDDTEILFNAIKGKDSMDSTTREYPVNQMLPEKMKIAIPRGFIGEGVGPEVIESFNATVKKLQAKGYEVNEVELPNIKYALAVYYVIMPAEVST